MDIFTLKDVSFTYPDMEERALNNINLHIKEGDFTVIAGPSGCGKTTLLRLLKRELTPVGTEEGAIFFNSHPIDSFEERRLIEDIGFVFQHPDEQMVMDEVMQELVFGLEQLGYSTLEMRKRVAELVHFFGLEAFLYEKVTNLSGGQKQMVNLLSVLLLKPKVLLLDEPTSQLDPVTASEFITMVQRLNEEMGITIILVEHRLEQVFALADRVILLEDGQVRYAGRSKDVISAVYAENDEAFMSYLPSVARLYVERAEGQEREVPLTVKDARAWLRNESKIKSQESEQPRVKNEYSEILQAKNVFFQYEQKGELILKNFSISVNRGEFLALVGGNGAGKTTALKVMLGIEKQQRGQVKMFREKLHRRKLPKFYKRIAYLPQHAQAYFSKDSIYEEMKTVAKQHQLSNIEYKIDEMLHMFQITHLKQRHPYDCSGGEMQRAALATMLLTEPEILFVDEPTKGFDAVSKRKFGENLQQLHKRGLTIVMVTHDIEFAAQYAQRCAMLFEGEITAEGTPKQLFQGNYFYTTAMNRATRNQPIPEALTLEEALQKWPKQKHAPI